MNRKVSFIVTKEEELKNPAIVYSVMNQWMNVVGLGLIDYNEYLINYNSFLKWLLKKEYIKKEKYNKIISKNFSSIHMLLFDEDGEILKYSFDNFPSMDKAYQIVAEYISENKKAREDFIWTFCTSFDESKGDENRNGIDKSYDAEDGFPICCHILEYDLQENTMTKEQWLKEKWDTDISFTDEYNYLKAMSFEECDKLSEEDC